MTNHADVYACVIMLFAQKWYLLASLAIILYSTRLALLRTYLKGTYVYSRARLCTIWFMAI